MGDTDKPQTLEERVAKLEADGEKPKVLEHEVTTLKREYAQMVSDHAGLKGEVTGLKAAWDIFLLGVPALFSLEPVIERVLEKKFHITRARSGFLSYTRKAKRDARALAERLESADYKIGKLKEDMLERFRRSNQRVQNAERRITNSNNRINALERRLGNSNRRIGDVERKVARLGRWADGVRAGARSASSDPQVQATTNRVTALRRQVDLLSAALS
ncbi:hypothetical protein O1L60_22955 [Streptomyces diastatochromogenes]|nr:hypothetical protein [Streptomyces diastatochromogenes]